MRLQNEFNEFMETYFSSITLSPPVFYQFPIGIRFEIGIGSPYNRLLSIVGIQKVRKPYLDHCISRAAVLFEHLFKNDEIYIVSDNWAQSDQGDIRDAVPSFISSLLPIETETESFDFFDVRNEATYRRFLYKTSSDKLDYKALLKAIALQDLLGKRALPLQVFIINRTRHTLYHFYDDRGLDIVAARKSDIAILYQKFNDWILPCDREKIDAVFINK